MLFDPTSSWSVMCTCCLFTDFSQHELDTPKPLGRTLEEYGLPAVATELPDQPKLLLAAKIHPSSNQQSATANPATPFLATRRSAAAHVVASWLVPDRQRVLGWTVVQCGFEEC